MKRDKRCQAFLSMQSNINLVLTSTSMFSFFSLNQRIHNSPNTQCLQLEANDTHYVGAAVVEQAGVDTMLAVTSIRERS